MRVLAKTGIALAIVAAGMVMASTAVLHAQGVPHIATDRARTNESRPLAASVNAIEASGPIDVYLTQGPAASMVVHADTRLLGDITTEQQGNVLRIGTRGTLLTHGRRAIRIDITLPAVTALSINGSGDLSASGFKGDALALALNGSGDLRLNGQFKQVKAVLNGSGDLRLDAGSSELVDLTLNGSGDVSANGKTTNLVGQIRGSGDIRASGLTAENASLKLSGSGDADVYARQKVDAATAGSGDVHISGRPAVRAVSRAGSGEVSWN